MNPSHPSRASAHESIEARAAAWLAQRDDDGLTTEDAQSFAAWRAEDPRHEAAVKRLEATWNALEQLRTFRPEAQQHPDRDLLAPHRRPRRRLQLRPVFGLAVAAAAITAFFILRPTKTPMPLAEQQVEVAATVEHYATTSGGYQRTTLSDGSIVELNENSAMTAQFTAGERHIELIRGEIHCTVAKDAARPFTVNANGILVRAVGTAFNVRLNSGAVEVLVTEGQISLHETDTAAQEAPLVSAGERAVVTFADHSGLRPQIERLSETAIGTDLAWQGSRLVFVEKPLTEVIAQFNRRNKIQIQVADPSLGQLLVDGSFQAENVEALVRLIANQGSIQVERPSPELLILRRAP